MPIAFVVFDEAKRGTGAERFVEELRASHPRWTIQSEGSSGARLGVWHTTPVTIHLNRGPYVGEESAEMADELAGNGEDAATVASLRGCTARFEIEWDLPSDPEPEVETADLMLDPATDLGRLVDGVAILSGRRLTSENQIFDEM